MPNDKQVKEVEYTRAKNYKRWLAFLIDAFIALILGLFVMGVTGAVTKVVPAYQNIVKQRDEIENSVSIYQDGEAIILVMDKSESTVAEKKKTLNDAIEDFYSDTRFFTEEKYYSAYQERKKEAKATDGGLLFELDATTKTYKEKNYSDQEYYNFYYSEIEHYLIAYMSLNSNYVSATNAIVRTSVIELILSLSIGYILSFIIVPLIIKRGRRTIGMYLFKISLIGVDALNVNGWTLFARDMLLLFIGYWLSIATIFIPWAVSVTMMHLSKRGQDFFDYVTNTYVIDSSKKDVYLSYAEYLSRNRDSSKASIENQDFHITS